MTLYETHISLEKLIVLIEVRLGRKLHVDEKIFFFGIDFFYFPKSFFLNVIKFKCIYYQHHAATVGKKSRTKTK